MLTKSTGSEKYWCDVRDPEVLADTPRLMNIKLLETANLIGREAELSNER